MNHELRLAGKTVIVTGAAQGFGEGIANRTFYAGANVVVADLNDNQGNQMVSKYRSAETDNSIIFIKTDVTDPDSVKNLMSETVNAFGELDVLISNAGVLKAGSLDELEPDDFDFVTRVNYKGFYLCTKYASEVMKARNRKYPDRYTDIIQINSKSGLQGSNRNFAYSGSKFGSIGLTQSFALELIKYRIKVNAICPGNFFDGPLWSDPQNGLFVQYLRTGKVDGAKTLNDVRRFYEEKVPMQRGCSVDDVMTAVFYVIEQKYETGQAVPVTGGQIMLS